MKFLMTGTDIVANGTLRLNVFGLHNAVFETINSHPNHSCTKAQSRSSNVDELFSRYDFGLFSFDNIKRRSGLLASLELMKRFGPKRSLIVSSFAGFVHLIDALKSSNAFKDFGKNDDLHLLDEDFIDLISTEGNPYHIVFNLFKDHDPKIPAQFWPTNHPHGIDISSLAVNKFSHIPITDKNVFMFHAGFRGVGRLLKQMNLPAKVVIAGPHQAKSYQTPIGTIAEDKVAEWYARSQTTLNPEFRGKRFAVMNWFRVRIPLALSKNCVVVSTQKRLFGSDLFYFKPEEVSSIDVAKTLQLQQAFFFSTMPSTNSVRMKLFNIIEEIIQ